MSNTTTLSQVPAFLASSLNLPLNPKSWYPSPHRVILPQPWFLPLTLSSFIFSSLLPRKPRLWVATPALLLLFSHTRTYSTGDVKGDFGRAAIVFGFVLRWIDFGMLVRDGEIWKVNPKEADGNENGGLVKDKDRKDGLWQGLKNSLDLWVFNMRGINWSWRVNGIPDRAPQSKSCVLFFLLSPLFP